MRRIAAVSIIPVLDCLKRYATINHKERDLKKMEKSENSSGNIIINIKPTTRAG